MIQYLPNVAVKATEPLPQLILCKTTSPTNPTNKPAWCLSYLPTSTFPSREKTQFNMQNFSLSSISALQFQDIISTGEKKSLSQRPWLYRQYFKVIQNAQRQSTYFQQRTAHSLFSERIKGQTIYSGFCSQFRKNSEHSEGRWCQGQMKSTATASVTACSATSFAVSTSP